MALIIMLKYHRFVLNLILMINLSVEELWFVRWCALYRMFIPYSTLSSPPQNDRHFAKLRGGLDKGDFYFPQIYIKIRKKIWVNQIFLIYYDFIKNNSYINLDDGNHIGIIWSCSNEVKTHNVSYIP